MNNILIVEDDKDIRNGIKTLLLSKNYSIIEAENGKIALEKIDKNFPDLIISDIMMPELSGIEFYKKFKNHPDSYIVPFIFLSAKTGHEDIRTGMNLGVDDYITKPFTAKELFDAVENKLVKRQLLIDNLFEIIARRIPHELRTPLVGSLGFTELIMDRLPDLSQNELMEFLTIVQNSNQRLHRVINEILNEFESKYMKVLNSGDKISLNIR